MTKRGEGLLLPAVMLIVIGVIFFIAGLLPQGFSMGYLWPAFPLAFGLGLCGMFFFGEGRTKKMEGVLMPGTILTLLGLAFFYSAQVGWNSWARLWPIVPFSIGLGFYMMYLFGKKEKELLIPGTILSSVGLIFFLVFFVGKTTYVLWPVIVIAVGVGLMFHYFKFRRNFK